jgi:hypothetical protein
VRISRREPGRAQVRWLLAGIDEISVFRLVFRDDRFTDIQGSGTLARDGRSVRWAPAGPYAHLSYTVTIDHRRPPGLASTATRRGTGSPRARPISCPRST